MPIEVRIKRKGATPGMQVLLKYPDPSYDIRDFNPLVGTEFECSGKITSVSDTIRVRWANGTGNVYKDNELVLFDSDVGQCEDMWQQ